MSNPSDVAEAPKPVGFDWAIAHRFNKITGGFWRGPSARIAWFFTLGLAGFLVLRLFVDVAFNRWNRWFFDAVGNRDGMEAGRAVLIFLVLVCCAATVGVGIVWTRETLQVRWRQWCTGNLLDNWIGGQKFFRMTRAERGIANPEYRISDDVRQATEPLTDFAIGMFTALLAAATFIGVLWSVGGSMTVPVFGASVTIPAFMVVGAFVYGITMSCLVPIVGRRLGAVTAARNESEALFRAHTIQMRENAESISLTRAEAHSRERLDAVYSGLVVNWLRMVRQHCNVTWITNANGVLVPTVPIIFALPKYLDGQLTLGEVMQLASAFAQVQFAIGWLTDNYRQVAEWFASARRVVELVDALEDLESKAPEQANQLTLLVNAGDSVALENLTLRDRDGRPIMATANVTFAPGEKVSICGETGTGKSVLMRALLGFWPWGSGTLSLPEDEPPFIAHASPWLPEGSLEDAIACPSPPGTHARAQIAEALSACGAGHLVARLRDHARWMQALSAGEKQRCAAARVILRRPRVLLMEDALSACDAGAQARLTQLIFERCRASIIIDVGNRPAPAHLYDRVFALTRSGEGPSRLDEKAPAGEASRISSDSETATTVP